MTSIHLVPSDGVSTVGTQRAEISTVEYPFHVVVDPGDVRVSCLTHERVAVALDVVEPLDERKLVLVAAEERRCCLSHYTACLRIYVGVLIGLLMGSRSDLR